MNIPTTLMKNIYLLILVMVCCLGCIAVAIATNTIYIIPLALVVLLPTLIYTIFCYRTFSRGDYDSIVGVCQDVVFTEVLGKRLGTHCQILIADSSGRLYGFSADEKKKKYRTLPEDRIIIYLPKNAKPYLNEDGIYEINSYYGYAKANNLDSISLQKQ